MRLLCRRTPSVAPTPPLHTPSRPPRTFAAARARSEIELMAIIQDDVRSLDAVVTGFFSFLNIVLQTTGLIPAFLFLSTELT
eukprot:5388244-Prymnesium_polylepis.1